MKLSKTLMVGWSFGYVFLSGYTYADVDPFLYLEDSNSTQALTWVKAHNDKTLPSLQNDPRYSSIQEKVRKIVLADDRIPAPSYQAGNIYNFWQDSTHVRGIWRRTSLENYAKTNPQWETVLDLDALSKTENENWVWKGANCLAPKYLRCMLDFSRGGQDASVYREFDLGTKSFVKDGFNLPEAKTGLAWLDQDSLLVGTDFGQGSLTDSGYNRIIKLWKRGTLLSAATLVFEGKTSDISVDVWAAPHQGGSLVLISEATSFFTNDLFLVDPIQLTAKKLPFPNDVQFVGLFHEQLLIQLRTDLSMAGQVFPAGALISVDVSTLDKPAPKLVYAPDSHSSILETSYTQGAVYISTLQDVKGKVLKFTLDGAAWKQDKVVLPDAGSIALLPSDPFDNVLLLQYESFLIPPTVYAVQSQANSVDQLSVLRKISDRFDPSPYVVNQFESTSKDGTKIPYFIIQRKDLQPDGNNPTLLYAYGGFEISEVPTYLNSTGKVWLEGGGTYVLANIRGGGEFGPKWHQDAILKNKQKSYDDFISVAEDLIARKITSPRRLAIEGGSNGGLLVGATYVERPDLFNAVVCQVPLLDMIRYTLLGAGASWEGEYGDPNDPVFRDIILKYSPYQNLKKEVTYPEVFFETSTQDDRVTPAHARKMAALMEAQGHPFYFYENMEGGHAADANLEEKVTRLSLEFAYLFRKVVE